MPYEILPGRNLVQAMSIPNLVDELRQMKRKPGDLKHVWFNTAIGRVFRAPIFKYTQEAIEEEFEGGDTGSTP